MCSANEHVRFTPNSDRECAFPQRVMSALPPEADMCGAKRNVRFGPKADIGILFDHVAGLRKQRWWDRYAERLSRFEIDHQFVLGWRLHGKIGGLLALLGCDRRNPRHAGVGRPTQRHRTSERRRGYKIRG